MKKWLGFFAVATAMVVISGCGGTVRNEAQKEGQNQQGVRDFGTPAEVISELTRYEMPPGQPITREMAAEPIAIVTEVLVNPNPGPVRVWIQSGVQLAADPVLFWTATTGGFPGGTSSGVYEIGAGFFPLALTRIRVLQRRGDQEHPAIEGQSIEVSLEAGERAEVQYLVDVPESRLCSMPAAKTSGFVNFIPSLSRVAFQGSFRRHLSVLRPGEGVSTFPKSVEISLDQSRSFSPKHRWMNPRQIGGAPLDNGCVGFFPLN
ncbi:MAG: hypothetical protein JNL01_08045 [Bdellovibrionales bacterium]|nr:hypothetical protein [Bdellovibrionales bacterium]